jgi:glycine betaine/proline transport system ATP-binding protein
MTIAPFQMETPSTSGPSAGFPAEPLLQCKNLWKVFNVTADEFARAGGGSLQPMDLSRRGWRAAVADCSIAAAKGEVFVIMGLSGSGKSTLIRCLARLIEPTAGEVIFEGRDLLRASRQELIEVRRHKMGMVFQNFALLPNRTVLGNVIFPLQVQRIPESRMLERARQVIDLVGLAGRERSYPHELSGGQQQRVGIARSLAVNPDLWFLDEPFSALDPLIRRDMQDELLRLQKLLHKTVIFITHDFDEAIKLADRIAIMKDGRIEQIGTAEELVLHPATPYVREFTQAIPRIRVVRAGSVMSPIVPGEPLGAAIRWDALLGTILRQALDSPVPLRVVDAAGGTVGVLHRETAVNEIDRLSTVRS